MRPCAEPESGITLAHIGLASKTIRTPYSPTTLPLTTTMITRRQAIRTIALTTTAIAATGAMAQTPAAPPEVFKLPALGYDYDALEPLIDAETMKIHHDKHHAAYVAKLNAAIAKEPTLASKEIEALLTGLDSVPEAVRTDIRNHGGGHFNHTLFWQQLKKGAGGPQGDLLKAIEKKKPRVNIFGHIHEDRGGWTFEQTRLMNVTTSEADFGATVFDI